MWDRKEKITINKDKLLYILDFFDVYLMQFIQEILIDSKEYPHFSAVAANNMILCYLEIMAELGQKLPYNSVKAVSYTHLARTVTGREYHYALCGSQRNRELPGILSR